MDALWGVGPVTARKLRARGITRLVDVRRVDVSDLRAAVGSHAEWLQRLALGIDDRPVHPNRETKSSGSERTYADDLTDPTQIETEVRRMAAQAADWLDRRQWFARTVTLKVRFADFTTITRSHSAAATRDADAIARRAVELLARTDAGRRPVRLLGVSVHNLEATVAPAAPDADRLPFEDGA